MKKLPTDVRRYFEWLRKQPCWFGGKYLERQVGGWQYEENPFPVLCTQGWNRQTGEFRSEVSHILKKGSTRRDDHFGNTFPNCGGIGSHHEWFEKLTPETRANFLKIGAEYYDEYKKNNF